MWRENGFTRAKPWPAAGSEMPSFGERGAEALAAYRQAREEEAERLRSLRATGVEEEHEFAPPDLGVCMGG